MELDASNIRSRVYNATGITTVRYTRGTDAAIGTGHSIFGLLWVYSFFPNQSLDARIIIGEFGYVGARNVFCEVSGVII